MKVRTKLLSCAILCVVALSSRSGYAQQPATPAQPAPPAQTMPAPTNDSPSAVLGSDAKALANYCVFQSQVYSPGVAFCVGEGLMIECRKDVDPKSTVGGRWVKTAEPAQCKGFRGK